MLVLPLIAEGLGGTIEAIIDTTALTLIAGPLVLWRTFGAVRRAKVIAPSVSPSHLSTSTRGWSITVAAVTLIGLGLTALAVRATTRQNEHEARMHFDQLAERLVTEAKRRVTLPKYGLNGAKGVYAASESVGRNAFASYAASRNLKVEFPGMLGFGFVQRVMRADLPAFVAAERADDAPDFTVRTTGDAPDLYIIKFMEPREPNAAAWGYDIGSEPNRRAAAERAVRSGEPTITAPLTLVQDEKKQAGFLHFVPVYKNGTKPTTPQQREAALDGLVFAPILLAQTFQGIQGTLSDSLDLQIYEGLAPTADGLILSLDATATAQQSSAAQETVAAPLFRQSKNIKVGG